MESTQNLDVTQSLALKKKWPPLTPRGHAHGFPSAPAISIFSSSQLDIQPSGRNISS